ncbi:hemerythrin [Lentzea sp. NBRC 105346]|uniref:hemerythrin domain-containing protein n=1 Tax=Lentzea sp. NBRC 105346 TaxID=3032205 RepID=UPI0024A47B4F|nr:hemerythrin domain-containing protein [Lentzea sp. NBRC 105346]GLZ33338.1 hemerythrin [Lentzea sp. NBRC 105346]
MADDVITVLHRQHEEIRTLFAEVESAAGDERKDAWYRLVRLLSIHETAEEEIVHPAVKRVNGGTPIVDARLAEERRAKELLSTMDGIGPQAEGFDTLLVQLRDDVLAHADHEEQAEFPLLRKVHGQERLEAMASAVRTAETIAPTRPHPGVEGPIANLLTGPMLAVVDRARDMIRKVSG